MMLCSFESVCWMCVLYIYSVILYCVFFVKQKTAYEMRISDWSSDVCSSDLDAAGALHHQGQQHFGGLRHLHLLDLADAGEYRLRRGRRAQGKIGRASCRERVCQYV